MLGFLKTIGKFALGALGGGGGADSNSIAESILSKLGGVGNVAAGAAKGSSDQRLNEALMALQYGRMNTDAARDRYQSDLSGEQARFQSDLAGSNAQFGAGMQGAQFAREGQDRTKRNQILSSLIGNMQDLTLTPGSPSIAAAMGQRSGGARPSALTGNKEALMAMLGQPEVQAPTYQGPAAFQKPAAYVPPTLPGMPQAGTGEKLLGGLGLAGNILGALGGLRKQREA